MRNPALRQAAKIRSNSILNRIPSYIEHDINLSITTPLEAHRLSQHNDSHYELSDLIRICDPGAHGSTNNQK